LFTFSSPTFLSRQNLATFLQPKESGNIFEPSESESDKVSRAIRIIFKKQAYIRMRQLLYFPLVWDSPKLTRGVGPSKPHAPCGVSRLTDGAVITPVNGTQGNKNSENPKPPFFKNEYFHNAV